MASSPIVSVLIFHGSFTTNFSGGIFTEIHAIFGIIVTLPALLAVFLSNRTFGVRALMSIPELYLEARVMNQNKLKITAICLLLALIDAVLLIALDIFFMSMEISDKGYRTY